MSESKKVWKPLKKSLDEFSPIDYSRIENRLGTGTPDVNICFEGGTEWWLELKYMFRPPSETMVLGLKKDQQEWIRSRVKAGGNAAIVFTAPSVAIGLVYPDIDLTGKLTTDKFLQESGVRWFTDFNDLCHWLYTYKVNKLIK